MDTVPSPTPGFLVWRLAMKLQAAVDRALTPVGLTHAQYSLLASLRGLTRSGSLPSQRQLADHTGLEPVFVSKLLRTLQANGLVDRTQHPADTRAVQLALTAEGVARIDLAIEIVGRLQDDLFAPLGGIEGTATRQLTRSMRRLLEAPPIPASSRPATSRGATP